MGVKPNFFRKFVLNASLNMMIKNCVRQRGNIGDGLMFSISRMLCAILPSPHCSLDTVCQ